MTRSKFHGATYREVVFHPVSRPLEKTMHPRQALRTSSWVVITISALILTQACANGDAKQGTTANSDSTGGADSSQGGSSDSGGTSNPDVTTGGVTATGGASGGVGQGGAQNTDGGADTGGDSGAGGQAASTGGAQGGAGIATGGASATGGQNTGGAGTGGSPWSNCNTSLDCVGAPNGRTICDASTGSCVECVQAADCGDNFDCTTNQCVHYDPCTTSPDCPDGKACDTTRGRCVECVVDTDCASGKCLSQTCRLSCTSDNACTPSNMLCNPTLGYCVECNASLKCAAGLVCDPTGVCIPPICTSGDRTCSDGGIATCVTDGSAYGDPAACPEDSTCKEASGTVACYADSDAGDGCAVGGDPCTRIPRYTETQVLDGFSTDFCSVPAALFDKSNSKVIPYHIAPPEVATVRVAWSSVGLHAFIDVLDSSVQVVSTVDPTQAVSKIYQGDSIELMISSSNTVTGLTSTDKNTLHITVPASGQAVSVKTSNINNSSQGAYTVLPTSQYAQHITGTGYAIELRLPWPGGTPTLGTTVRFDMALNSADKDFTSVDDMRDGQLIYHLGTVTNTTCQGTDVAPYCDDRTWCSTQLTR